MSKPRIRSPSLEIVSYTPRAQPASVSSESAPISARNTNGKKRKSTDGDVTKAKRAKATSAEELEDPAERWKWINLSKPEMYAASLFCNFFSQLIIVPANWKARKLKCPTAVGLFLKLQPRLWKCGWTSSKCIITNARAMRRVTCTMGIRSCANLGLRQGRKTQKQIGGAGLIGAIRKCASSLLLSSLHGTLTWTQTKS